MSDSSPEYWSVANLDGSDPVSLHQWGWSVTTVGGSRYDLPPRRGSDITIAYRPGQVHRRKVPDARQITLSMFMVGWDPATGQAPDDQLTQWNDNWDLLRRKVFRHYLLPDQRVRLIRRWFLTAPTFPTTRTGDECIQGDPGVPAPGKRLVSAFALAEMTGQMPPSMTGRFRAEFELDFTLPDPYFYGGTTVSATLRNNGTPTYIWNDGHDAAGPGYIQVDLYGPLIDPVITNLSTNPDSWVKYTGTIALGEHYRYVINRFTAERILTNGAINKIAGISNYGARYWVNVLPGANKFTLTAAAGTGTAVIAFRPSYV